MSVPSELLDSQDEDDLLDRSDNYFFGTVRKDNKHLVTNQDKHQTSDKSSSRRLSFNKSIGGTVAQTVSKNESFIN